MYVLLKLEDLYAQSHRLLVICIKHLELTLQLIKYYARNIILQKLLLYNVIMEQLAHFAKISVVLDSQQVKAQQLVQLTDLHVHIMEQHAKQK